MPAGGLTLPFSAVYGMEDAKRAILCAAASPSIRTVLIRGGPGSAKTVLARAAGGLTGMRVVNVPLNATEDMIFGGMDAEATVREGRPVMARGLLAQADGGILYVDDANLMDQRVLASVLDCVATGRVVVEREGVSGEYPCDAVLVATMNPEDSDVSPHLLDRFDLCAYSDFPNGDERGREEVLRRNAAFARDPEGFAAAYAEEEAATRSRLERARRILPLVTISDELLGVAVELCARVSADGFRGDIAMAEASRAIAALNGRDEVMRKDVEEAAMICLAHRRSYSQPPPPPEPPEPPEEPEDVDEDRDDRDKDSPEPPSDDGNQEKDNSQTPPDASPPTPEELSSMLDEMLFEIGEQFRVIDYLQDGRRVVRATSSRKGRRAMAESLDSTGRYARSRVPEGRASDVAFDATIRAAAPYQRGREHGETAVAIESQDIRVKVRERRSGCTILFLVDASGSLGVRRRMAAVKGAVMSMLRDSYVRRDRIGLMAFRRDSAELVLPPTRSVEYSYRKLEELPTGGRTPLGQAMVAVGDYMTSYSRSHPGESCYIVLITDGRANVPLREGADANEEARAIAADMAIPQVRWIVVDASTGYIRFDNAERLALELGGTYFRLEDLNADRLAESVRSAIGRSQADHPGGPGGGVRGHHGAGAGDDGLGDLHRPPALLGRLPDDGGEGAAAGDLHADHVHGVYGVLAQYREDLVEAGPVVELGAADDDRLAVHEPPLEVLDRERGAVRGYDERPAEVVGPGGHQGDLYRPLEAGRLLHAVAELRGALHDDRGGAHGLRHAVGLGRLPEGYGALGAGGQAVAHPVAEVLADQLGLAVDYREGALVAGGHAQPAAVALLLVYDDVLTEHALSCGSGLILFFAKCWHIRNY